MNLQGKSIDQLNQELVAFHPDNLDPTPLDLVDQYKTLVDVGRNQWATKRVVFAGLARNIELQMQLNAARLAQTFERCKEAVLVVLENNSQDKTRLVLENLRANNSNRVFLLGQNDSEPDLRDFSQQRIHRMARYRAEIQSFVRANFSDWDLLVLIDLDMWGGWSMDGLMTSLAWGPFDVMGSNGRARDHRGLVQYDRWAFMFHSWEEEWSTRQDSSMEWFFYWNPPRGAKPVQCLSVFGGLAVYSMPAYLAGEYGSHIQIEGQARGCVEHAAFHYSLVGQGYGGIYLNPSQRVTVNW